ncbi:MAG: NUDIX hydrolase [Chloroflexota bacterium]|jgi:ADP-ribose pyrophosphatase
MRSREYASRIQWQGNSWRLRIVEQPLADGSLVEKGVIEHPGSVLIVAVEGTQVLMLSQYRLSLDEWILELPAGTREPDEPWLACARRELREETGYRASQWTELGRVWPAPGLTNELMAIYLAHDLSLAPLPGDADEEIEVRPMALDELVTMALDGRLQDAKSAVGILRAAAHLGS